MHIIGLPSRAISYTQRPELTQLLSTKLHSQHFVVLSGLKGTGKTLLANAYAYAQLDSAANRYELIAWLNGATHQTRLASFKALAQQLNITEVRVDLGEPNEESFVQSVLNYFEQHPGWLLIYDEVADTDSLEAYLPRWGGDVIITSRSSQWPQAITVGLFKPQEAIDCILNLIQEPIVSEAVQKQLENDADQLAKTLHYYPLAIHYAVTAIKRRGLSLKAFINLLDAQPTALLMQTLLPDMQGSLQQALNFSIEQLLQADHSGCTKQLLTLCAFIRAKDIPYSLLEHWANYQNAQGRDFAQALAILLEQRILEIQPRQESLQDEKLFSISPWVQQMLLQHFNVEERQAMLEGIIAFANDVFLLSSKKYREFPNQGIHSIYAKHAKALVNNSQIGEQNPWQIAKFLNTLGRFYQTHDIMPQAFIYYYQAKQFLETAERLTSDLQQTNGDLAQNEHAEIAGEILHNLGSLGIRLWEVLLEQEKILVECSLAKALQWRFSLVNTLMDDGQRAKKAHYAYYTQRAIARVYKKQERYTEAIIIFKQLLEESDYAGENWLETQPLAKMDLSVAERLLANKQKIANSITDTNYEIALKTAIERLEQGLELFQQPNYTSDNKLKDEAVHRIRLAEAYHDYGAFLVKISATVTLANQNAENEAARHYFLQAEQQLWQAKQKNKNYYPDDNLNLARIYYRLAEVNSSLGYPCIAHQHVQQAIAMHELLFKKLKTRHPYLQASDRLLQALNKAKASAKPKLGKPLLTIVQLESQLEQLNLAYRANVHDLGLIYDRAYILFALARYAEAIVDFTNFLQLQPGDKEKAEKAHWLLGLAHYQLKQYEKATIEFSWLLNSYLSQPNIDVIKLDELQSWYEMALREFEAKKQQLEPNLYFSKQTCFIEALKTEFATELIRCVAIAEGKDKRLDKAQKLARTIGALGNLVPTSIAAYNIQLNVNITQIFKDIGELACEAHTLKKFYQVEKLAQARQGLEQAIEPLAQDIATSYQEQIERLKFGSVAKLGTCAAKRMLEHLKSDLVNPRLNILEQLKEGLLKGKSNSYLSLESSKNKVSSSYHWPNVWTASGLFSKSGMQTPEGRCFVSQAQSDKHRKYGFSQNTMTDIQRYPNIKELPKDNLEKEQQKDNKCLVM